MVPQSDLSFPPKVKKVRLTNRQGRTGEYTVSSIREIHHAYLICFEEVRGRNEAEALKGARLDIPQDALPALEGEEFYFFEFLGASVYSEAGELLGVVEDLLDNAGQILLRISSSHAAESSREHLLPAVKEFVLCFDRNEKKLTVRVPDGLWEE